MGSVKDTITLEKPAPNRLGEGEFVFSGRYSIINWAHQNYRMPDEIRGKGAALCMMAAFFFERMREIGIDNHYIGLVDGKGRVISVDKAEEPTNRMRVRLARVIEPTVIYDDDRIRGHDYSELQKAQKNNEGCIVVPLEVIYRNMLPEGSSLLRKMREGKVNPKDFGFDSVPAAYTRFPKPIYDITSKFEAWGDRAIEWGEAVGTMGISGNEADSIKKLTMKGNEFITHTLSRIGLVNADGKFEFVFGPSRQLLFGDVLGTLDEIRALYNYDGSWVQVSKEPARQYYRVTQKDWVEEAEGLQDKKVKDWQSKCSTRPKPMDPEFKSIIEGMYMAPVNMLLGREVFKGVPSLQAVVKNLHDYFGSLKG